jgi:hypothetical protein
MSPVPQDDDLPPLVPGHNAAETLANYIQVLQEWAVRENNDSFQQAALVVGKVYNALLMFRQIRV